MPGKYVGGPGRQAAITKNRNVCKRNYMDVYMCICNHFGSSVLDLCFQPPQAPL